MTTSRTVRRLLPAVALAALLAQTLMFAAPAPPPPPPLSLPYANGFLVTGNYVTGGVDLEPASGGNGFLSGTIPMNGVPPNAEVLSAFLYWETIAANPAQLAGARFRGQLIDMTDPNVAQVTPASLTAEPRRVTARGPA